MMGTLALAMICTQCDMAHTSFTTIEDWTKADFEVKAAGRLLGLDDGNLGLGNDLCTT